MERVVIVTPSVYGTDNSATLFGHGGPRRRPRAAFAVIDDKTSESRSRPHAARPAFAASGSISPPAASTIPTSPGRDLRPAVERMKARGWHVQIYTNLPMITAVKDLVMASPVPVVFDHFGGAQAELGVGAARLCRSGGSRESRQGLCEDLRRLPRLEARA